MSWWAKFGYHMSEELALFGGNPLISNTFPRFNTIDDSEILAAVRVIQSGNLSSFVGAPGENFYGGHEVLSFEKSFSQKFGVANAISVNSWTSGLWTIFGSLDLEPGSEVLVSTWTMAATATVILHWGLIPVFVDIDPNTFNLDIEDAEKKITKKTRAIISPDIFGLSADCVKLQQLCEIHGLFLVSDSAQSPLAMDGAGNLTSSLCHIGGFSLNYHKHIHTGEGGVVVTQNDALAERVRMLRNHGEVAVGFGNSFHRQQRGILGMNLRMGEIEAAIGKVQLDKLDIVLESRRRAAYQLIDGLSELDGLRLPFIPKGYIHSFYVLGFVLEFKFNPDLPSRSKIIEALKAEGVPGIFAGYQNIHKLPLFEKQFALGKFGWPYSLIGRRRRKELASVSLNVAENFHNRLFFGLNLCAYRYTDTEVKLIICAFEKVWRNLSSLK